MRILGPMEVKRPRWLVSLKMAPQGCCGAGAPFLRRPVGRRQPRFTGAYRMGPRRGGRGQMFKERREGCVVPTEAEG